MNLDEYEDNITGLELSKKKFNTIPDLRIFKKLKILYLNHNNISDISPLIYLTNIEKLYLNHNNISNISPLIYLINLKKLNLNQNNISDIQPLQYLTNLEKLYLSDNNISDITSLQCLSNLKIFYLSIKPFIVKEINSQLSINQNIDKETIKQVYQSYTENEIEDYKCKVIKKYENYKFISWM